MSPSVDHEPILRKLNPRIIWRNCHGSCRLGNLESRRGTLIVPSSYEGATSSKNVKITFWRFTSSPDMVPKIHLFVLAGGPGHSGRVEDPKAKALIKFFGPSGLAVYLIDPRGLGQSSPFMKGHEGPSIVGLVPEITQTGPFPVAHLTARNTALDVGMIIVALQQEPDYNPDSTWHVFGGSYGALLANQVVFLNPNLLDSVYMTGLPRMRDSKRPSGRGVSENCALDAYCREQMGGNVWKDFRKSIENVLHPETNECTQAFSKVIDRYSGSGIEDRQILLAYLFRDLIYGRSTSFNGNFAQQTQLILLFLRVTSDCVNPDTYVKEVLAPMTIHLQRAYLTSEARKYAKTVEELLEEDSSQGSSKLDGFVNTIGILDIEFYSGPPRLLKSNENDLHDDIVLSHAYARRYDAYKEYLKDMEHTLNVPLRTGKTRVFLEQGRLDLHTTYQPTKDAFDRMVAPEKTWYMLDSMGHRVVINDCWFQRIGTFLGFIGQEPPERCIAHLNEFKKSNWKFEGHPKLGEWWKYVRKSGPASPIAQQVLPIPHYQYVKVAASQLPSDVPPAPAAKELSLRLYPSTSIVIPPYQWIALFTSGALLLLAITLAAYSYFSHRRSPSHLEEGNNGPNEVI